jgi:membrane-bound metal-dependent hydrolase YbcI (DUF457 family)
MKGIAHFVTGVAIATCFPEVVERAADGSLLPVLGGIAGILPDTLDFRFVRYFEQYDLAIDPGPEPNADQIAEQLAAAMRQAYESGEPQRVKLHTIRLGPDAWRRYTIRFQPEQRAIAVRIGPIVDTGQAPLPGSAPEEAASARVTLDAPLVHTYDDAIAVDIFSGPSFTFERRDDRLRVRFLAWHRRWSHSLTLATALGLGAAGVAALLQLLTGGAVTRTPLWAGLLVALGMTGHILEDQLGFMGSNLLYPFTRERTIGLQLIRSGDAIPNFLTVWTAVALILFNLDRFSAQPRLNPWWFLGLAMGLPLVALGGYYQWRRHREAASASKEALQQGDILSEAEPSSS